MIQRAMADAISMVDISLPVLAQFRSHISTPQSESMTAITMPTGAIRPRLYGARRPLKWQLRGLPDDDAVQH